MLQEASTDYPAEVTGLYLKPMASRDRTRQLAPLDLTAGTTNPYRRGQGHRRPTCAAPARSRTTRASLPPSDPSQDLVDYFLFDPHGPARVLRVLRLVHGRSWRAALGLPARLVEGFAPGEFVESGIYQVTQKQGHALGRALLPRLRLADLRGDQVDRSPVLPGQRSPGAVPPPPSGAGVDYMGPFEPGVDSRDQVPRPPPASSRSPAGSRPGTSHPPKSRAPATAGSSSRSWGWRSDMAPTAGSRRGAASGSSHPGISAGPGCGSPPSGPGIGRQPAETFYEYAGWLESELPSRAAEIRTIADGKVWSAYSGHSMGERAIEAIERAWDRLRFPLAGLAVRRRVCLVPRAPLGAHPSAIGLGDPDANPRVVGRATGRPGRVRVDRSPHVGQGSRRRPSARRRSRPTPRRPCARSAGSARSTCPARRPRPGRDGGIPASNESQSRPSGSQAAVTVAERASGDGDQPEAQGLEPGAGAGGNGRVARPGPLRPFLHESPRHPAAARTGRSPRGSMGSGPWRPGCAPRGSPSSTRGMVATASAARARAPSAAIAIPGDAMNAFCDALITRSTPQASISNGMAPRPLMPSTTTSGSPGAPRTTRPARAADSRPRSRSRCG